MFKEKLYKEALRLFLGDHVLDQINERGYNFLTLGANSATATVYSQDISEITAIDGTPDGHDRVKFHEKILTDFTEIIQQHGGIIEIYEQSKIYAYWRADIELNHAESSAKCALASIEKIKEFTQLPSGINIEPLKLKIGINSGQVIFGNIGSSQRLQYRMLGETVRLNAMLSSVNDKFGTSILITEHTKNLLSEEIITEEVKTVRVVGEEDPITIYQIVGINN